MYPIEKIPHVLDDLLSAVRGLCLSAHDDRDDTRRMGALLAAWVRYTASPSGEHTCEMTRVDRNRAAAWQR